MNDPVLPAVGRALIWLGLGIAVVGLLLWAGDKIGLGRLPGDLSFRGKNTSFHFPVVTSVVISLVLTVLLNLFLSRR